MSEVEDSAYIIAAAIRPFASMTHSVMALLAFVDRRHMDRLPRRQWRRLMAVGREAFWKGGVL